MITNISDIINVLKQSIRTTDSYYISISDDIAQQMILVLVQYETNKRD